MYLYINIYLVFSYKSNHWVWYFIWHIRGYFLVLLALNDDFFLNRYLTYRYNIIIQSTTLNWNIIIQCWVHSSQIGKKYSAKAKFNIHYPLRHPANFTFSSSSGLVWWYCVKWVGGKTRENWSKTDIYAALQHKQCHISEKYLIRPIQFSRHQDI